MKMTDAEIIKWLSELEPATQEQKKKINRAILIFNKTVECDNTNEFFKTLMYDEVESKAVSKVYKYYTDWCKENCYEPVSKIKFSKLVMQEFRVKSVTIWNCGNPLKVYKMI